MAGKEWFDVAAVVDGMERSLSLYGAVTETIGGATKICYHKGDAAGLVDALTGVLSDPDVYDVAVLNVGIIIGGVEATVGGITYSFFVGD